MMEMDSPNSIRKPRDLPFYQTPEHVQTSAKIISDAKSSLQRGQLRTISTRRPVTPQEGQRKLFGEESVRDPSNRPPSAFSLGSRHFDSESRPLSGTRLVPLNHKPKSQSSEVEVKAPKPPTDPNRSGRRPTSSRTKASIHHSSSVESSAYSSQDAQPSTKGRSGSLHDVSGESVPVATPVPSPPERERRVQSGPKERTRRLLEERGEGDGSEAVPRVESRSGKRRSRDSGSERAESGYISDTREGSAGSHRVSSAGRSGSASRREEESPEEAVFYNTKVAPLVDEMATHVKDKDPDKLLVLSDKLYMVLQEGHLLGKACKRRSTILKTVFKLLDVDSPNLLLKQARLILALCGGNVSSINKPLRVSGNNLTNVSKLVFKVSKEEKHDSYFLEDNLLELLLETVRAADPLSSSEALIYCCGALKFLTGTSSVVRQLLKLGCVEVMAGLLLSINTLNAENGKICEALGHILVQLTACLRNLADIGSARPQFLSNDVIPEIFRVAELYPTDADLMLNIARILSKLTMHYDCCSVVAERVSHFKSLLHTLNIYQRREDLVVRLSFILGNLTAKSDVCRLRLFQQHKAMDVLLGVFKHYVDRDLKGIENSDSTEDSEGQGPSKNEDVLIKLVRVIANLSINEEVGPRIAADYACVKLLSQILEHKQLRSSEELVLNTMTTINNLSFYVTKSSAITRCQLRIAESLLKFLEVENMEGVAEATRIFGNLSREKAVRDFLVKNKIDEWMVVMLDSGNREVVFTACGVLINIMADEEKRSILKTHGGISKLTEVLRDFARSDWQLGSMVCQTLWNYSGRITSTTACFGEQEAQDLMELLEEYLDKETALDPEMSLEPDEDTDMELQQYAAEVWETEFYPVAARLLNRMETHHSDLEPLEPPS